MQPGHSRLKNITSPGLPQLDAAKGRQLVSRLNSVTDRHGDAHHLSVDERADMGKPVGIELDLRRNTNAA